MTLDVEIRTRLLAIIPELSAGFPGVDVLYLFGSQASGKAEAGSDVDIAVYFANEALRADPCLDLKLGLSLEKKLGCPVDVVVMQRASPIMQHQVLAHGLRLFERDPGQRAAFELRSFKQYLDARHYLRKRFEVSAHGESG